MRGIIISYNGTPNTREAYGLIREGEAEVFSYVRIGSTLGMVVDVIKQNELYGMLSSLARVDVEAFREHLNAEEWHQVLVRIALLGSVKEGFERRVVPPFPGEAFERAPAEMVEKALGIRKDGLFLGRGKGFDVYMPLSAFRKHVAILAMSGAGKSNLVKHMLGELLKREERPAVVLIDVHGEYGALKEAREAEGHYDVEVVPLSTVKMGFERLVKVPELVKLVLDEKMPEGAFWVFKRSLREAWEEGVGSFPAYVEWLEKREVIAGKKVKRDSLDALMKRVEDILEKDVIGEGDEPVFEGELDLHRKAVIFDLSQGGGSAAFRLSVLLRRLFELRKAKAIPPTIVFVEEAHNFFSERNPALKEGERIAREGRKFSLSLVLITQRPVNLSQTILSQCNTHILMRIMNPLDQNRVRESVEKASAEVLDKLPSLETGEGIILGEGLNLPALFRAPKVKLPKQGLSYEEELHEYWRERRARERVEGVDGNPLDLA